MAADDPESDRPGARSGAGYGAIESVRLRLLLLSSPALAAPARAATRALARRHEVRLFGDDPPRGIGAGIKVQLAAARLAANFRPHLIHAIGVEGAAGAAGAVAEGIQSPLILTVQPSDLRGRERRRARRLIARAAAVVLERAEHADELRALDVERDLYVSAMPSDESEDPMFLGSIEIVYGRVVHEREVDLSDATPFTAQLIQIGRGRGSGDPGAQP